jgi:hypothetical protein
MSQATKLLMLLGLALTCSVAAASGQPQPPAPVATQQASLQEDFARVAVVFAVRVSAWAVSTTVARFGTHGDDDDASEQARLRPEPAARPLMPFYSFASVLPRGRGG